MENIHPLDVWRKRRLMTSKQMALILQISPAAISRIVHGNRLPSLSLVKKISKQTGISPGELRPDLAKIFGKTR